MEPRRPLTSFFLKWSKGSQNSDWTKAERFDPLEKLWVSVEPPDKSRPATGDGSPRKPSGQGFKSRQGTLETAIERPTWVPLRELVPSGVRAKVFDLAGSGPALIVEMLWSSSRHFPAHNGGQKYRETFSRLNEMLEGRISSGCPVRVLSIDKPVPIKDAKKDAVLYDRYSDWEKSFGLVASNSSHSHAPPNRIGAFEVHLVQGNWDPELCQGDGKVHTGPPVSGSFGILCSACAARAGGQVMPEAKQTGQMHSLLHSKLWSRRWPGLRILLGRMGAILIRPSPKDELLPVSLRCPQPFKPKEKGDLPPLERFNFAFDRKEISMPPDPNEALRQTEARLVELDCPAQKGWFLSAENGLLCRCGGGSHSLSLSEVLDVLRKQSVDPKLFEQFCSQHKSEWAAREKKNRKLDDFMRSFWRDVVLEKEDHKNMKQEFERAKEREEKKRSVYQQLLKTVSDQEKKQEQICKEYEEEHERAYQEYCQEAEQIYVRWCLSLVKKVPSHNLDLGHFEPGKATAQEAAYLVTQAMKVNEERRKKWSRWFEEVESWKRNESEEELAIFEAILSQRPDVAFAMSKQEELRFVEKSSEIDLEGFETEMEEAYLATYVDPQLYQNRLLPLKERHLRLQAGYYQIMVGQYFDVEEQQKLLMGMSDMSDMNGINLTIAELQMPERRQPSVPEHNFLSDPELRDVYSKFMKDFAARREADKVRELLKHNQVKSPCTVTMLWGLDGTRDKSDLDMSSPGGSRDFDHLGKAQHADKDCAENLTFTTVGTFPVNVLLFADSDGGVAIPFMLIVRKSGRVVETYQCEVRGEKQRVTPCHVTVTEEDLKFPETTTDDAGIVTFKAGVVKRMQELGYDKQSCLDSIAKWADKDLEALPVDQGAFDRFLAALQNDLNGKIREASVLEQRAFDALLSARSQLKDGQQEVLGLSQIIAQKSFTEYCLKVVQCVPDHGMDLVHLSSAQISATLEAIQQAAQLNQRKLLWDDIACRETDARPWNDRATPTEPMLLDFSNRIDEMLPAYEAMKSDCAQFRHKKAKAMSILRKQWEDAKNVYSNLEI